MNFEITTNLDTLRNQQITANFEAVSAWLDEELAPYTGMVVTADAIPVAKTHRAALRKVKDRIEDYRKEAKKAALAPYNAFEEKAKILTSKIDAAVENIDGQVKAFEKAEADAKIAELKAEYEAGDDEAKSYCPWERVYNPKWANKGYDIDEAKEEIRAALFYTVNDIQSIRDMGGDDTAYLLDIYRQTHDLNAVIRKKMDLQTAKEREEQRKREAEERAAKETAEKPKIEPQMTSAAATTGRKAPTDDFFDDIVEVGFVVECTKTQLAALGQYMRNNGIKYRRP